MKAFIRFHLVDLNVIIIPVTAVISLQGIGPFSERYRQTQHQGITLRTMLRLRYSGNLVHHDWEWLDLTFNSELLALSDLVVQQ